ncbi:MAG: molecular chaperone HtpG [Pseudomonadota bacterium]|nr:molecular chaperone HtpG [Pseudomonadota bacterium]
MQFQTEVKQLLQLMIHSLYSNKEIFLRELISNGSDACDKLRFESMQDAALLAEDPELKLRVSVDKAARTITVSDNGIGMSREEVIHNIGTIARSGTKEFLTRLTGDDAKDSRLIGQFGVGFYSAFIVADQVTLVSRRAGAAPDSAVRWQSSGDGNYTIQAAGNAPRGTSVTLHLREGEDELLETWRLHGIVRRYSDHIQLPIVGEVVAGEDGKELKEEVLNQASALWARAKSDISDEQYREFYKHVAHDYDEPLAWSHARVEGRQEYTELLYVPGRAPFDMWDREPRHGVKLYVKRVFIMEDAKKLLPHYLRFVRGVIDSNDLPLNVSREILQESRDIDAIRAGCTKKVLGLLEDLARDQADKYRTFWAEFGQVFKEGAGEEHANREKWAGLLRFATTRSEGPEGQVSLADYIAAMKEGQDRIWYVTAESWNAARNSPHLEVFRKRGIEVLLLTDRVDEWVVSHLEEFQGKQLASVARGDLDAAALPGSEPQDAEQHKDDDAQLARLRETMASALGERISAVRISHRLTESPACVVVPEGAMSAHLARMLKAAGQQVPKEKPILEINPDHPLIQRLDAESDVALVGEWSQLLLDQSVLAEGGTLDDPASFVRRLNALLLKA